MQTRFILSSKSYFIFPDYFGKNLDGLFDCMTDLFLDRTKHIELLICNPIK